MVTRVNVRRGLWLAAGILIGPAIALAATFNLFGPVNGILKGNANSPQTSAAASSDVIALWTGTCNSGSVLKGDGTCAATSTGTVTSVALTMPTGLSVAGSPVTTSGTLAVTTTLNGPVRGNGSGLITGNTSLTTEVSGVLPVANGGIGVGTLTGIAKGNGTSAFTAAASADVIGLWSGSCSSSTFLRGDGSCQSPGGGGTVTSVAMTVPTFLSVSGSPIISNGTLAVTLSGTALPVANGGTGTTTSTGTGNVVLSASPTLTGTLTAATVAATTVTVGGNNVCQSTGTNCPASGAAITCTTACNISAIAVGQSAYINKGTQTDRASTVTPALDPDLQFTNAPAGTYTVKGRIMFGATGGGLAANLFSSVAATNATNNGGVWIGPASAASCGSTDTIVGRGLDTTHTLSYTCTVSGAPQVHFIISNFEYLPSAGSGSFGLDWSQASSNATNTSVYVSSWLQITRLN